MRRQLRVLIVDRRGLARDGLGALIDREDAFALAGSVEDMAALRALSHAVEPDIILVDPHAVGVNEATVLETARGRWAGVRIVVLTSNGEDEAVNAAWHAGVDGYLLKGDGRAELFAALKAVSEQHRYLSASISNSICATSPRSRTPAGQAQSDGLSDREREVMRLIARGLRTREMAEKLSLSHKTVEKHRTNLMRKLSIRTAAGVAAYAIAHGYVVLERTQLST